METPFKVRTTYTVHRNDFIISFQWTVFVLKPFGYPTRQSATHFHCTRSALTFRVAGVQHMNCRLVNRAERRNMCVRARKSGVCFASK